MGIKLYVVPHSHIDMEWFWTVEDLERMLPELFYDSALQMLAQDENMTFAQDQSCLMAMMLEHATPQQKAQVAEWVASGRIEPVGGMYVQPELQEPCGEALIRQIWAGQKWLEEQFGTRAKCAWFIDAFGQIDQLPQILKQNGFDSYVFMRDLPVGMSPEELPTEFYCEGPDGSRILTHWLKNTYVLCESRREDYLLKTANVDVTAENEKQELRKVFGALEDENSLQHRIGAALILWGDDLYGQTLTTEQIRALLLEGAKRAGVALQAEDIEFCTPSHFFDAIRNHEALPTLRGDFSLPLYRQDLRGTFVSRMGMKLLNRSAEQALLFLEALAAVKNQALPQLEQLWQKVLFNQFHDTIAGSCVDEVYLAAAQRYQEVLAAAQKQKQQMLCAASQGRTFCVFNPTQFVRRETVRLPMDSAAAKCRVQGQDGSILPAVYDEEMGMLEVVTADLAPFAMATYHLIPGGKLAAEISAETLENEYYGLKIHEKTGDLVSIWDKKTEKELLRAPANVLVAKQEQAPEMEGALCLTGMEQTDLDIPAEQVRMVPVADGTCAVCVKQFLGFEVEKRITLRKGSPRIEFTTHIRRYTGADYLLLTRFSMEMDKPESVFETPFSIVTGRVGFGCAQKWAALREENRYAALLNKGTCGYWVEGSDLSMALLRAHQNYEQYGINGRQRGIARFFDGKTHAELASEQGDHTFKYALVCTNATAAQIAAEALQFNSPAEAFWTEKTHALPGLVTAVTPEFLVTNLAIRDGGLQIRGYSLAETEVQCRITLAGQPQTVCRMDLQGNVTEVLPVDGNAVCFGVRPYEIVTLCIKNRKDADK